MVEQLKESNGPRRTITMLLGVVVVLVLVGIALFAGTPQVIKKDGETLRDAETGKQVGVARKEFDGHIWRVFATVNLPSSSAGRAYHGWLTEPLSGETYYVGEFFPVQDGYSLTYSTEDDIRFFTAFQVSQEWADIPQQPSNRAALWDFEVVMPSSSPNVLSPAGATEAEAAAGEESLTPTPEQ